ncbi:50S ribosomal protein L18e [Candidatus Micrarchaeota archaeon]|nr:50S ribosomal protein L18e [Candidatus Micrarchaeota archaeon]
MKRGPESKRTLELVNLLRKKAVEEKVGIWKRAAEKLSRSARRMAEVNLYCIDRYSKEGDTVLVPGKVLSTGVLSHKVTVAAHKFSASAADKIRKAGGECLSIYEIVKDNPKGKGIILME